MTAECRRGVKERAAIDAKELRERLAKLPLVVWNDPEASRATVLDMVCNKSFYGAVTLFDTGCRAARLVSKQGSSARISECGTVHLAAGGEQGTLIRASSGGASIFMAAGSDRPVMNYYAQATPDILDKLGSRIVKRGSLLPLAGKAVVIYGEPDERKPVVSVGDYLDLMRTFHLRGAKPSAERFRVAFDNDSLLGNSDKWMEFANTSPSDFLGTSVDARTASRMEASMRLMIGAAVRAVLARKAIEWLRAAPGTVTKNQLVLNSGDLDQAKHFVRYLIRHSKAFAALTSRQQNIMVAHTGRTPNDAMIGALSARLEEAIESSPAGALSRAQALGIDGMTAGALDKIVASHPGIEEVEGRVDGLGNRTTRSYRMKESSDERADEEIRQSIDEATRASRQATAGVVMDAMDQVVAEMSKPVDAQLIRDIESRRSTASAVMDAMDQVAAEMRAANRLPSDTRDVEDAHLEAAQTVFGEQEFRHVASRRLIYTMERLAPGQKHPYVRRDLLLSVFSEGALAKILAMQDDMKRDGFPYVTTEIVNGVEYLRAMPGEAESATQDLLRTRTAELIHVIRGLGGRVRYTDLIPRHVSIFMLSQVMEYQMVERDAGRDYILSEYESGVRYYSVVDQGLVGAEAYTTAETMVMNAINRAGGRLDSARILMLPGMTERRFDELMSGQRKNREAGAPFIEQKAGADGYYRINNGTNAPTYCEPETESQASGHPINPGLPSQQAAQELVQAYARLVAAIKSSMSHYVTESAAVLLEGCSAAALSSLEGKRWNNGPALDCFNVDQPGLGRVKCHTHDRVDVSKVMAQAKIDAARAADPPRAPLEVSHVCVRMEIPLTDRPNADGDMAAGGQGASAGPN